MSYYKIENNKKTLIQDEKILANMGTYLIVQPDANEAIAERIDNFVYESDKDSWDGTLPATNEYNSLEPENRADIYDYKNNVDKAAYKLGIKPVNASYIIPEASSGYITKDIEIGNVSHIELSVSRSNPDTSVEFYIIDGQKEEPILPIEEKEVKNEKIFYGQKTRFTPVSEKDVVIKLDGSEVSTSLSEVINSEIGNRNYTADYLPTGNPYKYVPKNTKIKIKMIERVEEGKLPSSIYSVVIKKYGADAKWSI